MPGIGQDLDLFLTRLAWAHAVYNFLVILHIHFHVNTVSDTGCPVTASAPSVKPKQDATFTNCRLGTEKIPFRKFYILFPTGVEVQKP